MMSATMDHEEMKTGDSEIMQNLDKADSKNEVVTTLTT